MIHSNYKNLIVNSTDNDRYLLITHGGIINLLTSATLGISYTAVAQHLPIQCGTYTTINIFTCLDNNTNKHFLAGELNPNNCFITITSVNTLTDPY